MPGDSSQFPLLTLLQAEQIQFPQYLPTCSMPPNHFNDTPLDFPALCQCLSCLHLGAQNRTQHSIKNAKEMEITESFDLLYIVFWKNFFLARQCPTYTFLCVTSTSCEGRYIPDLIPSFVIIHQLSEGVPHPSTQVPKHTKQF